MAEILSPQPPVARRLADVLVHADTSFFEAGVVFALLLRARYVLVNWGTLRVEYPIFTGWIPPAVWAGVCILAACLIVYGLASPLPPTVVRRRYRAAGLAVAAAYYAVFALALALHPVADGEGSIAWALGSLSLLASGRLFGLVFGERDQKRADALDISRAAPRADLCVAAGR